MLDGTGLWRDVKELPSSLAATLDDARRRRPRSRRCSARRRPPRRRERERRRVLRRGRAVARVARGRGQAPRSWRCRAACSRAARSRGGRATCCSPSPRRASSATWSRRSTPAHRRRTRRSPRTPGSTLGSRAGARALVTVPNQRAVTHTQAFCGAVAAALAVWARRHVRRRPATRRCRGYRTRSGARSRQHGRWVDERRRSSSARDAVVFGSGPGVGGGARGGAAPEGGRRHPGGGRRDPGGRDLGDDGAPARRPRAQPAGRRGRPAPRRGRGDLRGSGGGRAARAGRRDAPTGGWPRCRRSPRRPRSRARSGSSAGSTSTARLDGRVLPRRAGAPA